MDRNKLRVRRRRDAGFTYKRDTPVKPAQRRRVGYRILLPRKRYYTLPEEPEEENRNESSVKPASLECVKPVSNCKSASLLSNCAFTENPINQTASHATEESSHQKMSHAGYPTTHTPVFQDFKDSDSPQSVTSCNMEPDTTLSSEEEDVDYYSSNCFSCGSATLSSIPSPEIFRKENEKSTDLFGKEQLSLYLHNKNSTLLDVSHAKSIQMQQPPNLSAIIDTPTIPIKKICVTSHHQKPEYVGEIQTDSFKSDLQSKTPPKLIVRRPILYKKKVWFKSPITAETLEAKPIPSSTSELSNLHKQVKPGQGTNPSKMGEISCREETLPLMLKLKRPLKTSQVKARFFDFGNDSEWDAYFQWMRERSDKLKNPVLFPFMLGTQEPSVL
ncbi:uncharacterized protein LOC121653868 isoform X1 [Melanotaenia boesemani]|uniref:uncharacterized protein LOC121653868 isoform X1 n=1 Tax=Melanotaenia boesemani TaxID=1250792 RepID=UPI001C040B18|nr:uncharacterized protein LOC121653868 isoform X1 [Melanotaenia boesemani]